MQRDFITAHNRLRSVVWQQRVDDIPVFEGVLISHTTEKGELVSVSSRFASDTARAGLLAKANRAAKLTAAQAVQRAAEKLDVPLAPVDFALLDRQPGAEQRHRFNVRQLGGDTTAELVWLPLGKDELRLCWNVVLKVRSRGEVFRVLVDAATVRGCSARQYDSIVRRGSGESPGRYNR